MLDIKLFREAPERIAEGLKARGADLSVDAVVDLDRARREIITKVEALRSERTTASKAIGAKKKAGEDAEAEMAAVREIGDKISALDEELAGKEVALRTEMLRFPNLPGADTPSGTTEEDNVVTRTEGTAVVFDFEPKPHWDLGEGLGIFDFARAAKMSGSGFSLLKGKGARLSRALIQFMLDLHTEEHGYIEVQPPFMVNSDAMTGTGQLPKFKDDQYGIEGEDLWLIPTAEVPLTNLYRDEILDLEKPIALTGYTPCFRKEAGAAGKMTRGMNRLHQFDKVELVRLVKPEDSYKELELLTSHAEEVLKRLGLHYRLLSLCGGDIGFSSARTIDIELWAPGQNTWLEVSSCSNFEDFQARRAGLRYRNEDGKPTLVHTLNGSGVAVPRLFVALLENGQRADGSVALPEALWPYMGGVKELTPA